MARLPRFEMMGQPQHVVVGGNNLIRPLDMEVAMWRTILAHVYVIIMATIVVMAGNILADRYGEAVVRFISDFGNTAVQEKAQLEQGVKEWNKKILE